jgi:protein-S-isoprenylcysteine O-methyltransferase Ste14
MNANSAETTIPSGRAAGRASAGSAQAAPRRLPLLVIKPGTKIYDFLFGLPLIVWYAAGFWAQAPTLIHELASIARPHPDPRILVDALAKGAVVVFAALLIGLVAIRKPASSGAQGFVPKAVAFLGAFLGVAILSLPRQPIGWPLRIFSTTLIVGGMSFAVYALLWLGRSISVMSEARRLVTGGPYAMVRHPLYLGEETALIGVTLQFLSPPALGLLVMQIGFQLYRMRFEEQVMREAFPEYDIYAVRVKRLIPGLY